jgi:purine-binding chemotaxis protein CheW
VVDIGGKQVGLAIDSVSHVVKINSNDIEPPPPVCEGHLGQVHHRHRQLERGFVVVLDINQIFSSEEISSL